MAQILIQNLLNNELTVNELLTWLANSNPQDEFHDLCTQKTFVTYFLNYLHDKLPKNSSVTPQKLSNDSKSEFDSKNSTFNSSLITSTPNATTSQHDAFSPIHNGTSLKSPLCLGDFIIPNRKSSSKKKAQKSFPETGSSITKRINPTNLNETKFNSTFARSENSFNFANAEASGDETKRDLLKKEIERLSKRDVQTIKLKCAEEKWFDRNVQPNPKHVTFRDKLENVVCIYEFLIRNGLVFNVVSELYFVISLLFEDYRCDEFDDFVVLNKMCLDDLFGSVHNVVYFACFTLEKCLNLFGCLDRGTLKCILENERLTLFSPSVSAGLERSIGSGKDYSSGAYRIVEKSNVCFVMETDSRSNFPTDASFQKFKKQRDLFYEILKYWEDRHMVADWNFETFLGRKVRTLLDFHRDPVNFMRLSKLFMAQLLSTCDKSVAEEEIGGDINCSLLTSLPNMDRGKLDLLKSRLVKKLPSDNCIMDFTGYEEFYKDFIVASSNPTFLRHLCDAFISELLKLNDTGFVPLEGEISNDADDNVRKEYVVVLKSLSTLAKFLGFIESLPYKYEGYEVRKELVETYIKLREKIQPNMHLVEILSDSVTNGTLILTIPWVCKYLSILDSTALKTKYYKDVVRLLVKVYRTSSDIPEFNNYMIKFSLGWLFEMLKFPCDEFFDVSLANATKASKKGIDQLNIVNRDILNVFCPFLDQIKTLVTSKTVSKTKMTVRHITPLTAVESPKRKLEIQLEEAFFNGQPGSTRKTVDFVAERVASICVKHLCYHLVPNVKKEFVKELRRNINEWNKDEESLRENCDKLGEESLARLKLSCDQEVVRILNDNLQTAINSLLPIDSLEKVRLVCVRAAKRVCLDKVKQWITAHITTNVFTREITNEIYKLNTQEVKPKPAFVLPPGGSDAPHDDTTESVPHILDKLRNIAVIILLSKAGVTLTALTGTLDELHATLTRRNDVNEAANQTVRQELIDLFLLLIAFQPSLVEGAQERFFAIWKLNDDSEAFFATLFCPRNIKLLSQNRQPEESWNVMAKFCVSLIQANVISSECFETQCTSIFRTNLSDDALRSVTYFLNVFVECYKKVFNSSKFTFLLEFLSDYCSDL